MGIEEDPFVMEDNFGYFAGTIGFAIGILLLSILISIGMTIYYIIHILNNEKLDKEKKEHLIWVFVTLLAGYIGQFIYWYMKIWKDEPEVDIVHEIEDGI